MYAETPRLILRDLTENDALFIVGLLNTPSWIKYIGDRGVRNVEQAKVYLRNGSLKSYREYGFGFYLVALKGSTTPIGMCGLIKRDGIDDVEIGFAFLPQYEGLGYGYEAATEVIMFASQRLHLPRLVAITTTDNASSQKLLRKLGLEFEKKMLMPGGDETIYLFGMQLPQPAVP